MRHVKNVNVTCLHRVCFLTSYLVAISLCLESLHCYPHRDDYVSGNPTRECPFHVSGHN